MLRSQSIHDEIVDDPAAVQAQQSVLRLTLGQPRRGIGQRPLQQFQGVGSVELKFAHVAQIEQAGGGAHRTMFLR